MVTAPIPIFISYIFGARAGIRRLHGCVRWVGHTLRSRKCDTWLKAAELLGSQWVATDSFV
jgi:hypothetical protein